MPTKRLISFGLAVLFLILGLNSISSAQGFDESSEYGPVVSAYLGYLKNEQEVVDDRASRREITPAYYRRNSNRIRALRQMAVRIALETRNDYLPELEAVSADEFGLLFEQPPHLNVLRVGEVFSTKFRYLGLVRSNEVFYVFARLDPYEQSEMREGNVKPPGEQASDGRAVTRTRRATVP